MSCSRTFQQLQFVFKQFIDTNICFTVVWSDSDHSPKHIRPPWECAGVFERALVLRFAKDDVNQRKCRQFYSFLTFNGIKIHIQLEPNCVFLSSLAASHRASSPGRQDVISPFKKMNR